MRILYSFLLYLLCPFLLIRLFFKGAEYRYNWTDRLGYPSKVLSAKNIIWFHAVSVGEVHAAVPLVKALLQEYAHCKILFTTTTPTGAASVQRCFGDTVDRVYFPYDIPIAVKRFISIARPSILMVMETELWPNVFHYCYINDVPIVLVNGRISKKSAQAYKRWSLLSEPIFKNISLVLAQGQGDATRFIELGVAKEKVSVIGNLKFDVHLSTNIISSAKDLREDLAAVDRSVWVAASTHQGEEKIILDAFTKLLEKNLECLLIIVPRHPHRVVSVRQLCCKRGFKVLCKSDNRKCDKGTQIFIVDTIGELLSYYAASDIAFVGGSFTEVGGHNMLEPASLGMPVIIGPHVFNFQEISQLLVEQGAAWQVCSVDELFGRVFSLLGDANLRHEMGNRGKNAVLQNTGAVERAMQLIRGMFEVRFASGTSKHLNS